MFDIISSNQKATKGTKMIADTTIKYRYDTKLNNGDKVKVYRNLTKECWSIIPLEGEYKGKVIGHTSHVYLANVLPKVSEKGRLKVISEKKKYVHAYLVGEILLNEYFEPPIDQMVTVTYNPYKDKGFVLKSDRSKMVAFTKCVAMMAYNVFAYKPMVKL